MKTIKIIIFALYWFLFITNVFAQEIQGEKKKVDSLFELIKKITPANQSEVIEIEDPDLEKAKQLLYEAYAYAPIEFENELNRWTEEWRSTGIKGVKAPIGIKPGTRLQKVKEKLAQKYGWEYVRFLETSYFIKVKIIDIKYSTYAFEMRNKQFQLTRINLIAKILDVIKGKEFYSSGDTITISYLPFWFKKSTPPNFEINQIYALPLKHWSYKKNTKYPELMLKLNGLHTLYKIENNFVYSPLAPEESPLKTWSFFKREFKKNFLIDK